MKFLITSIETHEQLVFVEANNEEEIPDKISKLEFEYIDQSKCINVVYDKKIERINDDAKPVIIEDEDNARLICNCKYYGNECEPDSDDICIECIDYNRKGKQ